MHSKILSLTKVNPLFQENIELEQNCSHETTQTQLEKEAPHWHTQLPFCQKFNTSIILNKARLYDISTITSHILIRNHIPTSYFNRKLLWKTISKQTR